MRRILAGSWLLAALLAGRAEAQEAKASFAVLPFENAGSYGQDKQIFQALELGIPSMLSGTLQRHPAVEAMDPSRLARAMGAEAVGPGQRVDAATAAQVGKEAGARFAVTGSFADFYGKFRVNARVVDTQSGEILEVVSNDAKLQDRAQLSAIIQNVSEKIVAAAQLPPYPAASATAVPTEAIADYSRALLLESQGDRGKARELYQKALTAAPGFPEATAGLQRVR